MTIDGTRPLAGIRVLDLTVALSGPYATLLLGGLLKLSSEEMAKLRNDGII